MSLEWADDFKSYGTTSSLLLDGIYSQITTSVTPPSVLTEDPDPNVSGVVFKSGFNAFLRYALPGGLTASGGAGFRLWFADLPDGPSGSQILTFLDAANSPQVTLVIDSAGYVKAYRGSGAGTLLGTSSTPVVTANAWNHVEAKLLVSDTVGTVEVRVNGVTKLTLTSQDTMATLNANYAQIRLGGLTESDNFYVKDLVVWNVAGSANNDFLGTVQILRLPVDADISLNWTPSSGTTGFNLLDNSPPVDGTDYITAPYPAIPAAAVFSFADLPSEVTSVKGLISLVRARKTDGGDGKLQVSLISNGDTDLGADRPITSAFTYWYDVSELSPDTGVAWTPEEVNDAELQIDRTL